MGTNLKRLIPQVLECSTEPALLPTPSLDSSAHICMASLKEIRRLSQFLPVIVLVPKSPVKNQTLRGKIAAMSTTVVAEREIFGLLDKAAEQTGRPNPEYDSVFGDVTVNYSEMTACRRGQPVTLTTMEFKTLKYLIQNARRVISRDELLNEVWGYENYPCTRTVDNHILRLRQKLEREPSRPVHFRTVHRAGYKFLP
jgi:DNA-binding response OmpR family regulator